MKHLVVIPTYNESETIEKIISRIFTLYNDISILIVDDSSPDGTGETVKNLRQKYKNLFLLTQNKKSGLAKAYINGFKWGIENDFDLFTSCDADFSHDPIHIKEFKKFINEGYDIVCGSRYVAGGYTSEKNFFRNLISIGGNLWTNLILRTEIKDLSGGYNTYTKQALEVINLDSVQAGGFIFQTEMKYSALKKKLKIHEVPINFIVRTQGTSKMTLGIVFEALFSIIGLKLRYK